MESHIYDRYIYGDKEYIKLLEVLRAHLCNEFGMEYGIVIFCRYNPEEVYTESNKVKVFPINPDVINRHFPDNDEIRNKYLEAINRNRNSNELYFIKQFRIGSEYLNITLTKIEELLQHCKSLINNNSWEDSYKSITDSGELNILDQLFFESLQKEFDVIPIPVLTTPAILLVIPTNFLNENKKKEVYKTISESIHTYLFNKLINEINTDISVSGINDQRSLIKSYLKVISEVLIPIKYNLKNEENLCFDWYGNYDISRAYQFELNLGGEDISFILPNFNWFDGELISNRDYYNVKEEQFKETIESIYKLIHKNWKAVREVEIRALAAYRKTITEAAINPTIIKGVIEQMQSINDTLEKALKINIDDFSQTLNTIITNRVVFELITENPGNECAYRIIVNGNHIKSYNKSIPHFGYKIFKEIIENAKNGQNQLYLQDFSFIEEIKLTLRNNTHNHAVSNRRNLKFGFLNSEDSLDYSSLNNSHSKSLSDPFANIICSLPYPDENLEDPEKNEKIQLMEKFKSEILKSDQPITYLAAYLKPYTDAYFIYKTTIQENDPVGWKKFICRLSFLNEIKVQIKSNVEDFDDLYKKAESLPLNELAIKRRELYNRNPDAQRHVKTRIYNNLESVINLLCSIEEVKDTFISHFSKSRLTPFDRSSDKLIYDVSEIDSTLFIEWVFK